MTQDEQSSFYSAKDNEDQNTSLLSYTQHAVDKSTIGENNLRLNMFFSLTCIVASLCLTALEWFMYDAHLRPSAPGANDDPEGHKMEFFVSVFAVRIEPSSAILNMPDFLEQCLSLTN